MKLWCVCKVGEYEEPGVRVPKVALYTETRKTWPHPTKLWALCRFSVAEITPALQADPDIYMLPDATLDAAWSTIPNNVRNAVKNAMERAEFTWAVQNTWTVRQVLNYAVNQLQPGVDCTVFDVRDIA